MKLFLFLFTFFTFSVGAQESKSRFCEQMNAEMNVSLTNYTYDWQYTYPNVDQSIKNTSQDLWSTSDFGLNYRNRFFIVGLNAHLFNTVILEPKVGINALFAIKNWKLHLGPFISFGQMMGKNQFDARQFLKVGGEIYFKTVHLSVSHAAFDDFKASQSQVYSMKGITFQLGKSVALIQDSKNKSPFLNQLYFESNISISRIFYGEYGSFTATGGYFSSDKTAIKGNLDVGFAFRTNALKTGINFSFSGNFIGATCGVNLLYPTSNLYLGPYVYIGHGLNNGSINNAQQQTEFGIETYIKRMFHISLGYSLYSNYKSTYNQISDMRGIKLKLGLALPLGKSKN